jgi:hypothetical protein
MATPSDRDADILGEDRPRLRDRWNALSRRVRLILAASAGLALLATVLGYTFTHLPPAPPSDPLAATRIRITQVGVPAPGTQDFDFTLSATATTAVAIAKARGGYGNLILVLAPKPGSPAGPGHPLTFHAHATICTCYTAHPRRGTPLLYVTLHNALGDRTAEVVPTAAQFSRIDRVVSRACLP